MMIPNFLYTTVLFHNTLLGYLMALGIFLGIIVGCKLIETLVVVRLESAASKTKTDIDDMIVHAIRTIGTFFYVIVGLYIAVRFLSLPTWVHHAVDIVFLLVVTFEVIQAIQIIARYGLKRYSARQEPEGVANDAFVHLGMLFARIVLWSVGLLFVLSNLGINITALAASLGVGSLAIALALQSILGDMFSSFSIYADKPFEVGDFISVGTDSGTVKRVGLKTTRLTTLQGEELVIANKELTSARVQNFKKMAQRRVAIMIGVEYSTSQKLLESIPGIVETCVEEIEHLSFNRCHLSSLGDSAIMYELVYHVDTREYDIHMDTKQAFHFSLLKQFEKRGISFAFPTQTIHLKKE